MMGSFYTAYAATVSTSSVAEDINNFYNKAVGFGVIAALLMITVGAVYITISGASPDKNREGKDIIISAISGLVLLLGAYLILKLINPEIVNLTLIQPKAISGINNNIDTVSSTNSTCGSVCSSLYGVPAGSTIEITGGTEDEVKQQAFQSVPLIWCESDCSNSLSFKQEGVDIYAKKWRLNPLGWGGVIIDEYAAKYTWGEFYPANNPNKVWCLASSVMVTKWGNKRNYYLKQGKVGNAKRCP